jgi:hypothetical protein
MLVNIDNVSQITVVYHIDVINHSLGKEMFRQGASHLLLCLCGTNHTNISKKKP